jgi:hypothetical protein
MATINGTNGGDSLYGTAAGDARVGTPTPTSVMLDNMKEVQFALGRQGNAQ